MSDLSTLNYFRSFYNPAQRHQQGMAGQWDKYEKAYLGEPSRNKPTGDDAWRSNLFYKYGHQQIQTLAAELASNDDPTFSYEGRTPEQDEYADTAQAIIGYQLQRDDYPTKRLLAAINAAVYGGQPLKVHWRYECVHRPVLKPSGLFVEEKIILVDQPTITLVDPRDFYYDPRARSMDDARYCFHRMRLTKDELATRTRADGAALYMNLEELPEDMSENNLGTEDATRLLDNDLAGERDRARRKGIEVVEMWTRERLITVAAGSVVIRDDPNPYYHGRLPFEVAVLQPSLNDVWGHSVMWLLRDVQEFIWTLDNASMDALKLAIDPPVSVDVTTDPENMNRRVAPGERFAGRGEARNIVEPMNLLGIQPFVSQSAIDGARNQMKQITGITDDLAGFGNAGSATQAAINQRQAKGRIGIMLRQLDCAFANCAEMMLQLNQQYLDLSVPIKLLNDTGKYVWRHISPQEIAGQWTVTPKNSSEQAIKDLHKQNLLEAYQALTPSAGQVTADGHTVNLTPILEMIAEEFKIPKARVVVSADQMYEQQGKQAVAQAHAQIMQQQLEQQAMPQQGAPQPQTKVFESMSYKDLPPDAQAAILQQQGLPSQGALTVNNPTQINNPISQGLISFHQAAGGIAGEPSEAVGASGLGAGAAGSGS